MCSESLADIGISSSTPQEPGTESNFGNVSELQALGNFR